MDEKHKRKNMFLTDKIARKAFCVGGLFCPIKFLTLFFNIKLSIEISGIYVKKCKVKILY